MNKINLTRKWHRYPLLSRFLTFLFFFSATMVTGNVVCSQIQPADCHNVQCTSSDVLVVSAYISAPNDMPIDCNSSDPFLNAELHLIVSSNTQRIGISLSGDLNTTNGNTIVHTYPIGNCFTGITLNNGANNNLVYHLGSTLSGVLCGPGFDLSNLFISWGTGNTDFCQASPNPMCPATPAKCRFVPGEIIPVTVKLEVDFSWLAGVCANNENSLTLNFTPSVITEQNLSYPLTFTWDFGDNSGTQTTTAASSSLADLASASISHTYAGAGTYSVTLVGADASPTFSKTSVHTIMVTACCNLATPTASITQPTCATSTGSVQVNGPVSGVTYRLSNLDNTYTADNNGLFSAVVTGTYSFTASTATCGADGADVVINAQPATPAPPILSVIDNCGGTSTITAKDGDGNVISSGLTWSNNATGNPITVTTTDVVTVTLTVGSCTSVSSNSVTPAPKAIPDAPVLSSVDNCGSSEITAKDSDGNILSSGLTWSNGATGNPITVTTTDPVTATLTVGTCTSGSSNSVAPAPKTIPDAPVLSVVDNCGSSVITAKDGGGNTISSGLTWSNGATGNPITVTTTDAVTVTLTVNSCISLLSNSVTPAPKTVPIAPAVIVVNNCGSSDLTASNYAGTLFWSNGSANASIHVTDAATYTVTQTTSNGCTSFAGAGVSAPEAIPTASIGVSSQSCTGGTASFTLTSTTTGTSVVWSKPAGADGSFSSTTASSTTYTPGPLDRKNGVTITLTTYLGSCINSTTTKLTTAPCGPYYTYTQGYYSSAGSSCTPTDGLKSSGTSLIQYALSGMQGQQLYLGLSGHSFSVNYSDASALTKIMPGGGTAAKLTKDYDLSTSTSAPAPPLKNGKIDNVLLSQAITLALNINIQGDGLKSLILHGGYLTTQKGIGCPVTAGGTCSMSSLKITTNTTLLNLLNGKTVGDLLTMASNALGGAVISGVSLTDINNAVDVINRSFDGGAFFLGYFNNTQNCSSSATLSISDMSTTVSNVTKLSVSAYPNPFTDKVTFSIVSPVSGKASLDIYNIMGQKLHTVYQGYLFAGRGQVIEYNVPSVYKGSLIYTLRVGDKQVNGKVIQIK